MTKSAIRFSHLLSILLVFTTSIVLADPGPNIYRVEGDIQKPIKLESPAPVYPPELKAERIQGRVIAQTVITDQGVVESIEIIETPAPEFSEAVRESLAQWKFEPATLDGEPVSVQYHLTINFRLPAEEDEDAPQAAPPAAADGH